MNFEWGTPLIIWSVTVFSAGAAIFVACVAAFTAGAWRQRAAAARTGGRRRRPKVGDARAFEPARGTGTDRTARGCRGGARAERDQLTGRGVR